MDIQVILDNLEKVIENRDRWYEPLEYSWDFLARVPKDWYFFPKEIVEIVPLDNSQKEKTEKARKWFRDNVSEKDNDVVSLYEISKPWPEMKVEPFRIMYEREFLDSCPERWIREGSLQLGKEMKRLDHMFFLSHEMVRSYFEKYCPNLNSLLDSWKLVNRLERCKDEVSVC